MIENPPGFLVQTEAQKAAWQNGYRIEHGIDASGWFHYTSTTAQGDVWLAAASTYGPWFVSLSHPGVIQELDAEQTTQVSGPGQTTFVCTTLTPLYATLSQVYRLGVSLPDAPLQQFQDQTQTFSQSTEAERWVVQRVGQTLFREALLKYWENRCPLTGITDPALLRASHIVAWADCKTDAHRLDVHNGILLSALWDAAFDKGLVSFTDDGTVLVSPNLSPQACQALGVSEAPKLGGLTEMHQVNLAHHRTRYGFD